MLIRITNRCSMGCRHCMVDAQPDGAHMSWDVFLACLDLMLRLETAHAPSLLMLSGGEPTEHPELLRMLAYLDRLDPPVLSRRLVVLLSNGLFLGNAKLRSDIFKHQVEVQVTNDDRFYPQQLSEEARREARKYGFIEERLRVLSRLGRAAHPGFVPPPDLPWRRAPMCFNLRSALSSLRSLPQALSMLAARGFFCSPSVNIDGTVVAGEAPSCCPIGNVNDTTINQLASQLRTMTCSRCGLLNNLSHNERVAIGEAVVELIGGDQ